MGNICSFTMVVKGKRENIYIFDDWMNQRGIIWMGRGAEASIDSIEKADGKNRAKISGWCKNSIDSALVSDAIDMRKRPEHWSGGGYDHNGYKLKFVTLYEACKELNLDMEVYSEEPGCEFQEHYLYRDGRLEVDETVRYWETFDEETGEFTPHGGFKNWDFEI